MKKDELLERLLARNVLKNGVIKVTKRVRPSGRISYTIQTVEKVEDK